MPTTYSGLDPIAPGPAIAGKGTYGINITTATDGDARTAASAMTVAMAGLDRTNWIGWRMVNGLENNSSVTPYPAYIWWSGQHYHQGAVNFQNVVLFGDDVNFAVGTVTTVSGVLQITGSISGNVTLAGSLSVTVNETIGGTLGVTGASTFTGTVTCNNTLTCSGAAVMNSTLTCSGAATFNGSVTCNGTATFANKTVHSGANAYNVIRTATGPNSGSLATPTDVNMWTSDVWDASSITATRYWRMLAPALSAGQAIRATVYNESAFDIRLLNAAGVEIVGLAGGGKRSVVLVSTDSGLLFAEATKA